MSESNVTRRTMLDAIAPPDDLVGRSAVLVAMTATRPFLDAALTRFTGLSGAQRAQLGIPFAWLMLDGHRVRGARERAFAPLEIPGLHELLPRPAARQGLLHAKVALLSFAEAYTGAPRALRLVVSTGNWTERSARHRLELVWTVEVRRERERWVGARDDKADLAAAAQFVRRVRSRYHVAPKAAGDALFAPLDALLDACAGAGRPQSAERFVHSLDESLYEQLAARLRRKERGYYTRLACGSGSFEQPASGKAAHAKPEVLRKLEGLAAPRAERSVAVEPASGGAVATWFQANPAQRGWRVVAPVDPHATTGRRELHAKFVLACHRRDASLSNGVLYLGSGNLTRRGFLRAHRNGGNVEVGVLLFERGPFDVSALAEHLFVGEDALGPGELHPEVAEDDVDRSKAELIAVPPVLLARVRDEAGGRVLDLVWREDAEQVGVVVVLPGGVRTRVIPGRPIPLPGDVPGALRLIVDGEEGDGWLVPVELPSGHVAASVAPSRDFGSALERLLEFPPSDVDDVPAEGDSGEEGGGVVPLSRGRAQAAAQSDLARDYPLHAAVEFLERLGAHQAENVGERELNDWLHHLEIALPAHLGASRVASWKGLGLDFRRVLRSEGFRPRGMTKAQAARYRAILDAMVRRWEAA